MPTQATKTPQAINFDRTYPGNADQPTQVRADLSDIAEDCPVIEVTVRISHQTRAWFNGPWLYRLRAWSGMVLV
jgi:hypothetical protein